MGIVIKIDSDSIWGDTDLSGIDTRASERKLEQMVADAVAAEYGNVEVSIESVGNTKISGVDDDDDKDFIREIESSVWQTWQWVVDKS